MKIFHQNQENNRKKDQRDFLPKSHFFDILIEHLQCTGIVQPYCATFFYSF